ncbi:SHOCT domain-containing protein [Hymenobacter sp. 15J16-1T3B]|uniref:SHOCT domain-containing protein n=1 Tax=Hymenobacter sp. 15J16-1T3B TaxID=2886941 RepID=UPI001D113761|nr:SHOCT domain-containing protein [Hymenobacter sp. 15J16-1T3B]MCC3157629.1 SHOCT domain-containing protein [Hymenobacter sp. 15J16-1T3B]
MDKPTPSPLETLRQLKEMLDAGAITPEEFNKLKQQLLFGETTVAPAGAPAIDPVVAAAPATPIDVPPYSLDAPISAAGPHVIPPPVEDPLLPPVAAPFSAPPLEPVTLDPSTHRPTEGPLGPPPADYNADEPVDDGPRQSPLAMVLIIGGVVALLALIGYLLLGNRSSERLTSNSITAADTTAVAVEEGPQAAQLDLPPVQAPETVRVQPTIPVASQPLDSAVAGSNVAPITDAAALEAATRAKVQRALTAFYNDLLTAPFNASQHFAPQVERFFSLQNTTPAGIEDELNRTHFPEFTESRISFDPSTLQISAPAEDGSITATFQERGRSLRKSLNQYQQTLAQVRARFDRNGKLTYFRQERLLENTFTDAKPAAPATPAPDAGATPQQQN